MSHLCFRCRWLLLLLALLLPSTQARAECVSRLIQIWPPAGSLPPNAIFLIEGYGLDRPLVKKIQSCDLVLASGSERLCLVPADRYAGESGVEQAVLRPERSLTPGAEYRLLASDEGPRADQWAQGRLTGSVLGSVTWIVDLPRDDTPPTWREQPRVIKAEVVEYGCGLGIGAAVGVTIDDNSPTLALTTVVGSDASGPRSFLLQPSKSEIYIGHDMCYGGFDLRPGQRYQATISLIDAAGNASDSVAKQIEFTIPHQERR